MTIDDMLHSTKLFLTPADIAEVLKCDPQSIRCQAQTDPSKLGYPVIIHNRRIRIPRIPFLRYLGYLEKTT